MAHYYFMKDDFQLMYLESRCFAPFDDIFNEALAAGSGIDTS